MSSIMLTIPDAPGATELLPGTIARVQNLDFGRDSSGAAVSEQMVPIRTEEPLRLDVDPGRYLVQLVLPSGRILSRNANVEQGEDVRVTFLEPEEFGLLSFGVGAVAASLGGALPSAALAASLVAHAGQSLARRRMRPMSPADGLSASHAPRAPIERAPLQLADGITGRGGATGRLRNGQIALLTQDTGRGGALWEGLAGDAPIGWAQRPLTAKRPRHVAEGFSYWKVAHPTASQYDLKHVRERLWAIHAADGIVEIGSLPIPWFTLDTGSKVFAELVGRRGANLQQGGLSISVADPEQGIAGLLNLLDNGRLASAKTMLDAVEQQELITRAIKRKLGNPLAACAASYIGLAISDRNEKAQWDKWLRNVKNFFPWLPDGPIVHARRIMIRPRSSRENEEVLPLLKESFRRGVPFYSVGVQLLRDMLANCRRDAEAENMHSLVSRVASRLDDNQAFTVLRYAR